MTFGWKIILLIYFLEFSTTRAWVVRGPNISYLPLVRPLYFRKKLAHFQLKLTLDDLQNRSGSVGGKDKCLDRDDKLSTVLRKNGPCINPSLLHSALYPRKQLPRFCECRLDNVVTAKSDSRMLTKTRSLMRLKV
jgi:hypothetical protein